LNRGCCIISITFWKNAVQACAICAEKDADGIFEFVEDKQLVGIGGNDKIMIMIRLYSESDGKPENKFIHAVLISRCWIKF